MSEDSRGEQAARTGIRIAYKIIIYVLAWAAALIATNPSLKLAAPIYMFPLGLVAFFNLRLGNDGGWWVIGGVTALYLVHAIFYFRSKTTRSTIVLLGILIALLVCNVAGCRAQQEVH